MTYAETLDYLYTRVPMFQNVGGAAYKEGLYNTHALDEYFGYRHREFKTIHVAGTNGKGSCSHTLAAVLQTSGEFRKVGLYTSPHLLDFRERFRINGEIMPEDFVINFVEKHRAMFEPLQPSFFELTTAMGFLYFATEGVDIAVIEVGLGGRLDCTNIITPELSIITNIGLDHTQFLGNTLEKIANEKAGIIKPRVNAVIGEATEETRPVFLEKAKVENAPIVFAEDNPEVLSYETKGNNIVYNTKSWGEISGELIGSYQVKNANTVLTALNVLKGKGYKIEREVVAEAFANVTRLTGLKGRWQTVNDVPLVVCDTGHNAEAFVYLSQQLREASQNHKTLRIVFGMVDDKDVEAVLSLLPKNAVYYFTAPQTKRAFSPEKITAKATLHGLKGGTYNNIKEAYTAALRDAIEEDFIFVGGSSYLVADFINNYFSQRI